MKGLFRGPINPSELSVNNLEDLGNIHQFEQMLNEKAHYQSELRSPTVDLDSRAKRTQKMREVGFPDDWINDDLATEIDRTDDLSQEVLDKVESRLGMETDKLHQLADEVSGMESDYGKNLYNPSSTAKGIYQFTDPSFPTAKTRLRNILGYLPAHIENAPSVDVLPPDDQKALFFAHLTHEKGSDARLKEYLKGNTSGADLYEFDHHKRKGAKADGTPLDPTDPRYVPMAAGTRKRMGSFFGI